MYVHSKNKEAPRIGVAWRSNRNSEPFIATCKAIEMAGAKPVLLDQVISADLTYEDGALTDALDKNGELSEKAVKMLRCNTWQGSNAEDVMKDIAAVIFPGGGDISPSLYYDPQTSEHTENCSPECDVSDFLLMNYCLETDIPILAICKGMQMLCLVSGTDIVQDIPEYYKVHETDYQYDHRKPAELGPDRDYAYHDVTVTDRASLLYQITGMDTLSDVPSWHHQAVTSVEGTRLIVSGDTTIDGIKIIEVVERPDKRFVLGLQFHPEIALIKRADDTAFMYFKALVKEAEDKDG